MTDEPAEFEGADLLRAIGAVRDPAPGVLDGAREVLWSAVAREMLGTDPAGGLAAEASPGGERERRERRDQHRRPRREQGARQPGSVGERPAQQRAGRDPDPRTGPEGA